MPNKNRTSVSSFVATFSNIGGSGPAVRNSRCNIQIKDSNSFLQYISTVDNDDAYIRTAGTDLSSLFYPFETNLAPDSTIFPHPESGVQNLSLGTSGLVNFVNLFPYKRSSNSGLSTLTDRYSHDADTDSMSNTISGPNNYLSPDRLRHDYSIRSLGLRLPMVGVGWGYTTDGLPWPSGSTNNFFAGDVGSGYQVDPKYYAVAPIDFRFDKDRQVWTTANKEEFLARIVGHTGSTFPYDYIWIRVSYNNATKQVSNYSPNQSGGFLPNLEYAHNIAEFLLPSGGIGAGSGVIAGIDVDSVDYPTGFDIRPVGAGGSTGTHREDVIVKMWNEGIDPSGRRVYLFDKTIMHDGTC